MSVIKDYLTLVRNGIKNGDKIIEALIVSAQVKNQLISEEALAEILRRKDICASCPFNSKNAVKNGYESSLPFEHCIHCQCSVGGDGTKEYCLSCNCGITEFNKRNPEIQLEPKWRAFELKTNNDE